MDRLLLRAGPSAILLASVLALAACDSDDDGMALPGGGGGAGDIAPPEDDPRAFVAVFEPLGCGELTTPVALTDGPLGDPSVTCGRVTVPSDWDTPDGDTIDLAVYRFASTAASPAPDPVVLLTGGPGQSGASVIELVAFAEEQAYLRERSELVVVDQRGTGYSTPGLICPEFIELLQGDDSVDGAMTDDLALDIDAALLAVTEAHTVCRDRLVGEGVTLADFTTLNNALDIAAVRRAIDVPEWNLLGISYGTDLALTVMREDPAGIRSVVLDSVFPPEVNGISEDPYSLYWALTQIRTNCLADADCNAAFDDIQATAEAGIARLAAQPIGDFTAGEYTTFLEFGVNNPGVPVLIETVATGEEAEITALVNEIRAAFGFGGPPPIAEIPLELRPAFFDADVLNATVICAEELPYLDARAGPDISAEFLESTRAVVEDFPSVYAAICPVYGVPAADPVVTRPVESDLPVLVIAGTDDSITPPAWSILAADSLSRSQYAEFPGLGHSLATSGVGCVGEIVSAFLADPASEADQGCIDELPRVDYVVELDGARSLADADAWRPMP